MNIEAEMLISILRLTKQGPVTHKLIQNDVRIPKEKVRKLLQTLQNDGLLYVHGEAVEATDAQRLEMAVRALKCEADIERVSDLLQWKEFEGMAAIAFEGNGYLAQRNLRFKSDGRRWEIDIVGFKKPLIVCVDCKHWHHGLGISALERIVKEQTERVRALSKSLPSPKIKVQASSWSNAEFVPVILSLVVDRFKFHAGVPIVPILQLQDFLSQLPVYVDSLLCFTKEDMQGPGSTQKSLRDTRFSVFEGT